MVRTKLERVFREQPATPENAHLLDQLVRALTQDETEKNLHTLSDQLAKAPFAGDILTVLAGGREPDRHHLAMLLAGRMPRPLTRGQLRKLRSLLLNERQVPREAQLDLAEAMLASVRPGGKTAQMIMRSMIAGLRKSEGLKRLREMEKRLGPNPHLSQLCTRLEKLIKCRCPRCKVRLSWVEMTAHLWNEHRLVVDGRRMRKPWRLIGKWITTYLKEGKVDLLAQSQELARRWHPRKGPLRLQRMLLGRGMEAAKFQRDLLPERDRGRASVCPHCFQLLPPRNETIPRPLNLSHGRLTTLGYRVEVFRRGFLSRLEIETPAGILFKGKEPDRGFTPQAIVFLSTAPFVLLALGLAVFLGQQRSSPIVPVGFLLLLASLVGVVVRWHVGKWETLSDRAVNYAWRLLVPRLHAEGFSANDSEFIAGLALLSAEGYGSVALRQKPLEELIARTRLAVADRQAPSPHLSALWRLLVEDRTGIGDDPVQLWVEQIAPCFTGKLPLACADQLLAGPEKRAFSLGNRARLRVLLCERAFEAGLETSDLLEAGRRAPALGYVLRTDNAEGLARLRLLWSLRPRKPWEEAGPAQTVFELAADPDEGRAILEECPDLLLVSLHSPDTILCDRGVIFEQNVFTQPLALVEVTARGPWKRGGYDLALDDKRFRFDRDPSNLVARLERWFRFYFNDFAIRLKEVFSWDASGSAIPIGHEVATCRKCGRTFVARPGELGIPFEETLLGVK